MKSRQARLVYYVTLSGHPNSTRKGRSMPTLDDILAAITDDAGEIPFEIGRMEMGLGGGTQYFYRIFPIGGGDYVGGVVEVVATP